MKSTKRLTKFEIIERVKNFPVIFIGEYKNLQTNTLWQCKKCGKTFERKPAYIFRKRFCKSCFGHALTKERFIERIKDRDFSIVGDFKGTCVKTKFKCDKDGHVWETRPSDILSGCGCPKCSNHIKVNTEMIINKLKENEVNVKPLEEINNTRQTIKWECMKCCHIFEKSVNDVVNFFHRKEKKYKYQSCPNCRKKQKISDYNKRIDDVCCDKNIKRIDDYISLKTKIKFYCLTTKQYFETTPCNIINKNSGSPFVFFKNENKVYEMLQKAINMKIKRQKIFIDNGRNLFVDFYIKNGDKDIVVEYNGIQHYKPTRFGGISIDKAKNNFKLQKERDKKIKNILKKMNIKLIILKYNDTEEDFIRKINYIKNFLDGVS